MRAPSRLHIRCLAAALLTLVSCSPHAEVPALQRLIAEPDEQGLQARLRSVELASVREDAHFELEHGSEFGTDSVEGWEPLRDLKDLAVTEGALTGWVSGWDPSLATDTSFGAAVSHRLWLRLSSQKGGRAQIFWASDPQQSFAEERSLSFMVDAGSETRDQLIPIGLHPRWKGSIRRLRLDLPAVSGSFSLDFLRVIHVGAIPAERRDALRGATGRAALDADSRLSLLAGPPSELAWSVVSEPGSLLRFSYGVLPRAWERSRGATRFSVAIASEGSPERPLFAAELTPHARPEHRRWHEATLPLPGGPLRIVFRTESPEPLEGLPHAVWGNPHVVTTTPEAARARPNVVLIIIDTLRADRVGSYGYGRGTTPHIDRFARGAAVFEQAIAQAPWTLPSLASLFTSQYPSTTGVGSDQFGAMSGDAVTLAYLLRRSGYATRALTGGGYVGRHYGLGRGFDRLWEGSDPDALTRTLSEWIEGEPNRPLFLVLHTYAAHDYFLATPAQREAAESLAGRPLRLPPNVLHAVATEEGKTLDPEALGGVSDLYDAAVRQADTLFGRWLAILASAGMLDSAVVVLTSDHGEGFGEHGLTHHGNSLYQELVSVPLLFRLYPHTAAPPRGRRVETLVELIDVAPTLLELAGVDPSSGMAGRSLQPLLTGGSRPVAGAFSELANAPMFAVLDDGWKYVYSGARRDYERCLPRSGPYCEELYRPAEDPLERSDLATTAPDELQSLRRQFVSRLRSVAPGLYVVGYGGHSTTRVEVRVAGAGPPAVPSLHLHEPGDLADAGAASLDLAPADLDVATWATPGEDVLDGLEVRVTNGGAHTAPPFTVGIGPACREIAMRDGAGIVRGADLTHPAALSSSSQVREPKPGICVTLQRRTGSAPETRPPPSGVVERLRALGYLE